MPREEGGGHFDGAIIPAAVYPGTHRDYGNPVGHKKMGPIVQPQDAGDEQDTRRRFRVPSVSVLRQQLPPLASQVPVLIDESEAGRLQEHRPCPALRHIHPPSP